MTLEISRTDSPVAPDKVNTTEFRIRGSEARPPFGRKLGSLEIIPKFIPPGALVPSKFGPLKFPEEVPIQPALEIAYSNPPILVLKANSPPTLVVAPLQGPIVHVLP